MFSVILWCFYIVFVHGDLRQVTLPVYTPPSRDVLLNTYFQNPEPSETNRTKKAILNVSDKFYKTIEAMKKELSTNISILQKELNGKNDTDVRVDISKTVEDYMRSGRTTDFPTIPLQPTTYRYPTAVWSSQNYEKLKNSHKFRPRNGTKIYVSKPPINPAFVYLDHSRRVSFPEKSQKRNRGKTKWKHSSRNLESNSYDAIHLQDFGKEFERNELVDRFLEESLMKYLISSKLKENVGNISVKTFSDILKNITEQKPKKLPSPYDENKELRMKFREEVILKKKNETKTQGGFLEKQLQKRLEKVQDVFNETDKDKILANMWKYTPLNKTMEATDEKKNKTVNSTDRSLAQITSTTESFTDLPTARPFNATLIYLTESPEYSSRYPTETRRGTARYQSRSRYLTTERYKDNSYEFSDENSEGVYNKDVFKLKAEESSYYRNREFPSLTFIGQPEKPGVIPGRPRIDYPVHSFPPVTKFKCPKFKEGKPRMMADPETRCQVFYICTGDGPTTAMLCPNGTMFNENFLVCDWWYNVNC